MQNINSGTVYVILTEFDIEFVHSLAFNVNHFPMSMGFVFYRLIISQICKWYTTDKARGQRSHCPRYFCQYSVGDKQTLFLGNNMF